MAPDSGQLRTAQAAQACVICKTRKKKCNRSLPSCAYCTRKELDCVYALLPSLRNHDVTTVENPPAAPIWGPLLPVNTVSSRMNVSTKPHQDWTTAEVHQFSCPFLSKTRGQVYLEVYGVIRATGQFVDDISARYFNGFHRHLPAISRVRFYNNLTTLGAAPAADFSVLLMTICLITHAPALGYQASYGTTRSVEQQSLYLNARSLFAQAQVSCSPSISLIQAGLLLAVYEYLHGRPDDAFVTIAGTARMAYAAHIHARHPHQTQMTHRAGNNADIDFLLQAEETANTWWGIVLCERISFSEVTVSNQPLLTIFPGGDARLPIEPEVLDQLDILGPESLPNIPMSCLTSPKVGGYSRTAQATCLLDQVRKCFDTLDIDSKVLQLDRLDINIQAFLSVVMPECQQQPGVFCSAIHIAIRALFTLHWHILGQHPQVVSVSFKPLEEWYQKSQNALDTVTKMVVDTAESLIAASPVNTATHIVDTMPPMYLYIARAALRHIHNSTQREDVCWLRNAEDVLQASLNKYFEYWSVSDDYTLFKNGCGREVCYPADLSYV